MSNETLIRYLLLGASAVYFTSEAFQTFRTVLIDALDDLATHHEQNDMAHAKELRALVTVARETQV